MNNNPEIERKNIAWLSLISENEDIDLIEWTKDIKKALTLEKIAKALENLMNKITVFNNADFVEKPLFAVEHFSWEKNIIYYCNLYYYDCLELLRIKGVEYENNNK